LRLNQLRDKIVELIMNFDIDEVAFEDIYMDGQRVNNVATFKVLAEVFGVCYELFTDMEIKNTAVLAGTWKSTLGIKGKTRPEQKRAAQ
jgi:Holliday junction resolvasome RuvABC endonuclease subunit